MKAFFLVFIFSLLVTSWLTESGPPIGQPIGVKSVVETATGSDVAEQEMMPDFYMTPEVRETQIITDIHSTGNRVGDAPRLGLQ